MRRLILEEPYSRAAIWSRRLALLACLVGAGAIAAARLARLDSALSLAALWGAIALACAALLAAGAASVVIWRTGRRGVGLVVAAVLLAALPLAFPSWLAVKALRLPVLNDISTDLADPPEFSRSAQALAARGGRIPPAVEPERRQAQRVAYPNVQPIIVDLDADEAHALLLKVVGALGWRLVEQRPPGQRSGLAHIDAYDRTLVMGFTDDVTIRIRPLAGQSRIDIRSASRLGRHDFGANAKRIAAFAEELQAQLDEAK